MCLDAVQEIVEELNPEAMRHEVRLFIVFFVCVETCYMQDQGILTAVRWKCTCLG